MGRTLVSAGELSQSYARLIAGRMITAILQPMPISHHFHGCTTLLVLRFVVVKWRYIKYLALRFTFTVPWRVEGLVDLGGLRVADALHPIIIVRVA